MLAFDHARKHQPVSAVTAAMFTSTIPSQVVGSLSANGPYDPEPAFDQNVYRQAAPFNLGGYPAKLHVGKFPALEPEALKFAQQTGEVFNALGLGQIGICAMLKGVIDVRFVG